LKANNTHKEARSPSANQTSKKFKQNSNCQQLYDPKIINSNNTKNKNVSTTSAKL
jgi:hypothetical protein